MELIKWADSRSLDGWIEPDDIDAEGAIINTAGTVVKETEDVVCIAASVAEKRKQCPVQHAGIMIIPKHAIISRNRLTQVGTDKGD